MRIAVDAMGGDYAPEEIIKGALLAHRYLQVGIALVGRPDALEPFLPRPLPPGITVVPAEEVVGMAEEPLAVRRKPQASINVSMQQVRAKQADAVVAAGNTGATMAAAYLNLGRLAGIDRPAIGALLPTLKGKPVLLLDVGANVDCRPRFLEQFARMGSLQVGQYRCCPIAMNGREVYKFAVQAVPEIIEKALFRAGIAAAAVQGYFIHQANQRILDAVAKRLQLDPQRVASVLERYGNTSGASVPIALADWIGQRRFGPGDLGVMAGFGAGLTWGAIVFRWGR